MKVFVIERDVMVIESLIVYNYEVKRVNVQQYGICGFVFYNCCDVIFVEYDECVIDYYGCDYICVNILGSFKCECKIGYEFYFDGKKCEGNYVFEIFVM